jgi:hypothetical protein
LTISPIARSLACAERARAAEGRPRGWPRTCSPARGDDAVLFQEQAPHLGPAAAAPCGSWPVCRWQRAPLVRPCSSVGHAGRGAFAAPRFATSIANNMQNQSQPDCTGASASPPCSAHVASGRRESALL